MAKFPISGALAIDPNEIKDCFEDANKAHTWIMLYSGRMYRTSIPLKELNDMIELAKIENPDKVESDHICKTQSELAMERKAAKGKKKKS